MEMTKLEKPMRIVAWNITSITGKEMELIEGMENMGGCD
jgi:hypothetical protein